MRSFAWAGCKTGFWLEELAAPYYVFKDAGAPTTSSAIPRVMPVQRSSSQCASADNRDAKARDDKHYPRPIRSNHANRKAYCFHSRVC